MIWGAYLNIINNQNGTVTHCTSYFRRLLWLKIGWMGHNKTFLSCKFAVVYIDFGREEEKVVCPYTLERRFQREVTLKYYYLLKFNYFQYHQSYVLQNTAGCIQLSYCKMSEYSYKRKLIVLFHLRRKYHIKHKNYSSTYGSLNILIQRVTFP